MDETKRLYQAIVWGQDSNCPGKRTTTLANDSEDAVRQLKQRYGEDITFSLYNEEDANKIR
jgi:hypothetical protein